MTHPSESISGPATEPPSDRVTDRAGRDDEPDDTGARGSTSAGLLTIEWHVSRTNDVTLVTVHVTNTHVAPREVRLDNRLAGPVCPPRSHGVPETGWDDDGVTRRVPGRTRVSIGYACHAPPETPPVEADDRPVGEQDEAPVDRALRSLGDFAPPRTVVSPEQFSDAGSFREPEQFTNSEPSREPTQSADFASTPSLAGVAPSPERTDRRPETDCGRAGSETVSGSSLDAAGVVSQTHDSSVDVPTTVETWFRAVEARLDTADRLGGDVSEAIPVIASLGGRTGLETLATTLEADAAALAHVAARANELAARVDSADVPDVEVQQ